MLILRILLDSGIAQLSGIVRNIPKLSGVPKLTDTLEVLPCSPSLNNWLYQLGVCVGGGGKAEFEIISCIVCRAESLTSLSLNK